MIDIAHHHPSHTVVVPVSQPPLTPGQHIKEAGVGILARIKQIALTCFEQIKRALSYLFSTLKNMVESMPPAVKTVAVVGGSIALIVLLVSKYRSKQEPKKVEPPVHLVLLSGTDRSKRIEALFGELGKIREEGANFKITSEQKIGASLKDFIEKGEVILQGEDLRAFLTDSAQGLIERSEEITKKTAHIENLLAEINRLLDEEDSVVQEKFHEARDVREDAESGARTRRLAQANIAAGWRSIAEVKRDRDHVKEIENALFEDRNFAKGVSKKIQSLRSTPLQEVSDADLQIQGLTLSTLQEGDSSSERTSSSSASQEASSSAMSPQTMASAQAAKPSSHKEGSRRK